MKLRTTQDLSQYLQNQGISPEALAREVLISNMTIRRFLQNKPSAPIPQKYWAQFDAVTGKGTGSPAESSPEPVERLQLLKDFDQVISDLEEAGHAKAEASPSVTSKMQSQVKAKSRSSSVGVVLREMISTLMRAAASPKTSAKSRAIAIGALIYFLNPVDLIADALPGVGYLDDFAVVTMAISALRLDSKSARENGRKKDRLRKK